MFGNAFGWPHLLIILAVVLLLFGATKLPGSRQGRRPVGQDLPQGDHHGRPPPPVEGEADDTAAPDAAADKPAAPSSADKTP